MQQYSDPLKIRIKICPEVQEALNSLRGDQEIINKGDFPRENKRKANSELSHNVKIKRRDDPLLDQKEEGDMNNDSNDSNNNNKSQVPNPESHPSQGYRENIQYANSPLVFINRNNRI